MPRFAVEPLIAGYLILGFLRPQLHEPTRDSEIPDLKPGLRRQLHEAGEAQHSFSRPANRGNFFAQGRIFSMQNPLLANKLHILFEEILHGGLQVPPVHIQTVDGIQYHLFLVQNHMQKSSVVQLSMSSS
ncbi:hypothetical protein DL771_003844 [Monosporascus sp. 5C6A]|nr:hypothetical protein DL771_003844 [Monosporascus sp. 5C6A]